MALSRAWSRMVLTRGASSSPLFAVLFSTSLRAHADYPIASHRYLADPASLVHEGRVYLYASNDDDNAGDDGYKMASIVCVSSSDLKNWTDHGEVLRVPRDASWANFSWAPAMASRDGTFFMYFGNNANGIGVASSASPTGPFTDAKGSALVNSSTPGATGTNSWLFDPGVFIDDDGQAYLYFGGNDYDDNARVIELNDDMISVSGSAVTITAPNFFEASWMHKRDGVYYFSYSTDPGSGQRIDYMTSSSPTSGFTHRGAVGDRPPSNDTDNNHAAIFEFDGKWYHAYHNRFVAHEAGVPSGYRRSLALEPLEYETDGTIKKVSYTLDAVQQLGHLNPYVRVEAETFNAQSGVETQPSSEGGMNVSFIDPGDFIRLRGVDFGAGAVSFNASVASESTGGTIELRLDDLAGSPIGTCTVPVTGAWQTWMTTSCDVSGAEGVHDLYLSFGGAGSPLFNLDYWQFTSADGTSGGSGGGGAASGSGSGGTAAGGTAGAMPGGAAGATTSAGVGGAMGTGGAMGGASVSGSGGAASSKETGGCGCRSAGAGSPREWFLSIAALMLAGISRRGLAMRGRR
jgi:arabinoxylan arabinofuranohydrolase